MNYLILFITAILGQEALKLEIYNMDGSIASDTYVGVGYFIKEARLRPNDGSKFKSEFIVSSFTPIYPQFPRAQLNSNSLSFLIAAATGAPFTFQIALSSLEKYYQPQGIAFQTKNVACNIAPSALFNTIVYGGKRTVTLDFSNCLPTTQIQVQASYGAITKMLTMPLGTKYLNYEIIAGTNSIGNKIDITFSTSYQYYSIQPIQLTVFPAPTIAPVASLSRSETTCVTNSITISVSCSVGGYFYFAYYYTKEPSFTNIQSNLILVSSYSSGMEGMGYIKINDNLNHELSLSNLKSNTIYKIVGYCLDEYQQFSGAKYLQFNRCDSILKINKLTISSYITYNTADLRQIVCGISNLLSLNFNQISTNDGIYCDGTAQWKYGYKVNNYTTNTLRKDYIIFIYPLYQSTTYNNYTITQLGSIGVNSIIQFQPVLATIRQEYIAGAGQWLNVTISTDIDSFIYIGLDAFNLMTPSQYNLMNGTNNDGILLEQFYKTNLLSKQHKTFNFRSNDNKDYQIYYMLASDPSDGAILGSVVMRSYNYSRKTQYEKLVALYIIVLMLF